MVETKIQKGGISMNDLMIFNNPEFGEIRTIEEDGKVLFKARNAARYLGHAGSDIALPENGKTVGRTRWTQKDRLLIHALLKADGLLPVHEIEPKTEQTKISSNIQ